jgi:hypothetical protein
LSREKDPSKIDYPEWFWEQGLRVADLLILVDKGKTESVARQIFRENKHIISTSWRINAIANLFAQIYYTDSEMLNDTIEVARSHDSVSKVEFSEIVKVVDKRSDKQIEENVKALEHLR